MATKITPRRSKQPVKKETTPFMSKLTRFLFKVFLWFIGLSLFFVVFFKFVPVPFTPLMVIRAIENKMAGKEIYFSHDWESLDNISVNLQKAVIASEDGTFLKHNGFDFVAMQKAYKSNERGRRIKGGSTISQQTAKNVFLWQGRSYLRKGLEAYFTVLIETIWGKKRIMEVYLNSIEMGDGVYGAQAAAEHWYRKDASNLTPIQAAGIAAILPNPRKYSATSSSSYINRRKAKIVRVMRHVGRIEY
ncbi:monofunctional biosynthetic peptidoglycan transglycosylase [Flavobacterium gawalongense]|uniref:Biosynthetic peptidoglycan transglycosylase n=1 Tax=Flavobacterium gawalongense TaxID=2594432 RepID=A0A553B9I6_9FLAO|nr:monofunctional biosynthetic peptidoglycan transglycosylase [Flavobacterium gawalongense]TRW96124.1 monofunctional biosynthetic peptidoglycan transglycosylase [Flavobacterium gawalongense]TRX00797.1 monofunctional biosynthetic peptidoglycan transglycosylase [Flavobacterium gawalongense]TRX04914.1 monofunctional biosynthetic peptidoglycan transglycosylase [Flavobacterium gawalongense]TRX05564.1 monofunctional biosynthetic peptidoglycan transglycosylase [Flavobacterium gawalongense]TRX21437.1 